LESKKIGEKCNALLVFYTLVNDKKIREDPLNQRHPCLCRQAGMTQMQLLSAGF